MTNHVKLPPSVHYPAHRYFGTATHKCLRCHEPFPDDNAFFLVYDPDEDSMGIYCYDCAVLIISK